MEELEDFIYTFEDPQREIMLHLHHMLTQEFDLVPRIRFNVPFYYQNSWISYLNPTKDGAVELAFIRANELSNEQGMLDFKGRKQVGGVEFRKIAEIPVATLAEVIQEAILLDETKPYASKRKKRNS